MYELYNKQDCRSHKTGCYCVWILLSLGPCTACSRLYLPYLVCTVRKISNSAQCGRFSLILWRNVKGFFFCVFSSPEHKVILQCPASVVRPSVRASIHVSTISLNYISSETAYWILTKLHRNDPWVVPYQSCSNRSSWLNK